MIKIGRSKNASTTLLAYPGFGYPTDTGQWRIHVSGVAWQEPVVFTIRQRMMIRMLGGVMKATPEDLKCETFQNRITPFMAEAEHRLPIVVEINGQSFRLKKKTRKNGHFHGFINLPKLDLDSAINVDEFGNRFVPYQIFTGRTEAPVAGIIYLYDRTGVSVVSDIDDTIKESSVGDRRELLANTFLRDFRSVDGMADVYQQWADSGASFHYVSSSPWQLYKSLEQMNVLHRFPAGTMHLRNFRLRDQLLKKVIIRRHGKTTAIRFLMKNMPHRKFVLIGDSGEKDPEIYRKVCKKFPGRVKALLIRDVPNRPLDDERTEKLAKLFQSDLSGKFAKFTDAAGLAELSSQLFETADL